MSNSLWPHELYSPWNSPGQNTGAGSLSLLQGHLPDPGIQLGSPALQADSLPAEPQGKPKNPGVGSLSLLQWIFLTQESNWSLLHCRRILYQLSYEGSPWGKLHRALITHRDFNSYNLRLNNKTSTNFFFLLHNFIDRRFVFTLDLSNLSIQIFFLSLLIQELSSF